jgi:hypothetical protein
MSFSDILTISEILISVVVGFYLAHWYSVRDTQHRAVKDYYITMLSNLQADCEFIFHGVLNSSISGAELLSAIDDLDSALEGFDEDLRRALPIKLKKLQDLIGDVTDKLTDLNDINVQLYQQQFNLGINDRITVRQLSKEAHRHFGVYINQININPGHHVWHELWSNIRNTFSFFKARHSTFPILRTLWSLLCAFWTRLLMLFILLLLIFGVWKSYRNQSLNEEDEKKSLQEWRNSVIREMKMHNAILEQIGDSLPVRNEDVKNYHDCIFHRYDTCDSTIYKRVK